MHYVDIRHILEETPSIILPLAHTKQSDAFAMTISKPVARSIIVIRDESSQGISKEVIAGITVAAGAICVAVICVIGLLARAIIKRKRNAWGRQQNDPEMRRRTVREIVTTDPKLSKPRKVLSRSNLLPYDNHSGWDSLVSQETMSQTALMPSKLGASMPNFSKVIRPESYWSRKGENLNIMPMRKFPSLHNSESSSKRPWNKIRSRVALSACDVRENAEDTVQSQEKNPEKDDPAVINLDTPSMQDLTALIGKENMKNLKPQPLFAGTPKHSTRAVRAKTIGSGIDLSSSLHGTMNSRINKIRPPLHSRSISLGGYQPCPAPNVPVPPLPLIQKIDRAKSAARRMIEHSPSRHSDSSFESVGSSLLGLKGSPKLQRTNTMPLGSPIDHARQRSFANWIDRPQETTMSNTFSDYRFPNRPKPIRRMSDGVILQQVTRANTISSLRDKVKMKNHTSASDIIAARRISSISARSYQGADYIPHSSSTPTRYARPRTTIYGSPCERRKPGHVRNLSQSNITPIRHPSLSSLQAPSTRSSNGNPFQWDRSPSQSGKPSAMKGSPGARKGQKRQNSVRISLAPTILGPCNQSPTSSVMNDIREESSEQESADDVISPERIFDDQPRRKLPRPPSTSTFAPRVSIDAKPPQASLADNSPTLSLVDLCEDSPQTSSKRKPLSEIFSSQLPGSPHSRNSSVFSVIDSPKPPSNNASSERISNNSGPHFLGTDNDENTPPSTKLERLLSFEENYFASDRFHTCDKPEQASESFSYSEGWEILDCSDSRERKAAPESSSSPALYLPGLKQSCKMQASSRTTNRRPSSQQNLQRLVQSEKYRNQQKNHCSLTCHHDLHQIALRATPRLPPKANGSIGHSPESPHSVHKSIIALRRMDSDNSITSSRLDRQYLQFGIEVSPSLRSGSIDELQDEWGDFQCAYEPMKAVAINQETEERRSRIWEEGENFWKNTNNCPSDNMSSSNIPCLKIVPPSTQGTPASLYDRDGFLK